MDLLEYAVDTKATKIRLKKNLNVVEREKKFMNFLAFIAVLFFAASIQR